MNPFSSFMGPSKPKPAELGPNVPTLGVRQVWTAAVGSTASTLQLRATDNTLWAVSEKGDVAAIDARTGADVWRAPVGTPVVGGIGSDGRTAAVVTEANEVVALEAGRVLWRQKVPARVYSAPFVAGGRVFVLTADRSVLAFDGSTGVRLWSQPRPGEPLVLQNPGVLLAVGDTLVVGVSGRLAGLNPVNGSILWEAPLATPRGTNDVERLVDLVGPVSRVGDSVCARAFQTAVGCVDTSRGNVQWTKPASGGQGVDGDDAFVFGTESNGTVVAWRRRDGERAWSSSRLQYRVLSAPLLLGRSVVVGDDSGNVHFLSRDDGVPLNRLTTDGSAITSAPVVVGQTLVVVTRKGGVFGFRPE